MSDIFVTVEEVEPVVINVTIVEDGIEQIAGHVAATDPHGDRAYANALVLNNQIFNVKTYGAVGNGSTDDTAAFTAAFAAAKSVNGGCVFIPTTPTNTYIVSTLYVPNNIWLAGQTENVELKKKSGTTGPVITEETASDGGYACYFSNFAVNGNKANCPSGTDGFGPNPLGSRTGFRCDFTKFENLNVHDCKRHGFNLGDVTNEVYLVSLQNCWSHHNDSRGVNLVKVYDSRWSMGWVANNVAGALYYSGCANVNFSLLQLEGRGIVAAGVWPAIELDDTLAGGNAAIGVSISTMTDFRTGLLVKGNANDIRISGTRIDKCSDHLNGTYSGVLLQPGSGVISDMVISGCMFGADTAGGVSAPKYHIETTAPTGGGGISNLVIVGNVLSGTSGGSPVTDMVSIHSSASYTLKSNSGIPDTSNACVLERANYSIPNASNTAVLWDAASEKADPLGLHSTATNTNRINFIKAGVYTITYSAKFADNSTGVRIVDIEYFSGTTQLIASARGAIDSAGRWAASGSVTKYCTAGSFVALNAYQSSGVALLLDFVSLSATPTP